MIRLNQTATQLLSLTTAQNGASVVVSYSDKSATGYDGNTQVTAITSATTTTICATPAASTIRDVDHISIRNTFAGNHAITLQLSSSATLYPLVSVTLANGDSLEYTHGSGFQVLDSSGQTKQTFIGGSMTSAQLAGIITDETGSGALVFATSPSLVTPILGTPTSGDLSNCTSNTESAGNNSTQLATTAYADRLTGGTLAGSFTTLNATGNIATTALMGVGTTSLTAKFTSQAAISTVYAGSAPTLADCLLSFSNVQTSESTNDHATIQFTVNGGTYNRICSISAVAESATSRNAALVICTDNATNRNERIRFHSSGGMSINNTSDPGAGNLSVTGAISATTTIKSGGYTVATLPAGTAGMRAYVTDATAPTWLAALTGGGAVVAPVFHNGTAWLSA